VYRYGVLTLGLCAAMLLIGSAGNMNALVPLFAIGVFLGFTLAQAGLVCFGWGVRGRRPRPPPRHRERNGAPHMLVTNCSPVVCPPIAHTAY
ncbi:hypothetical protein, partial [Nocardia cyriacigeorgica]|uniref:hypothetical protein n=1 Tax=Nocardia cyriacigeorgica TaxID=135487 RepID=UPI002455C1AD